MESAMRARPAFGNVPSARRKPARFVTPMRVPMLSNMSTSSSVRMRGSTMKMALLLVRNWKVSLRNTGAGEAGAAKIVAGSCVTILPPTGTINPSNVMKPMLSTIAPGTRRATRMAVRAMPARQSQTGPAVKSPCETKVAEFATITPPFFRPMNAMKRPMPHVTAIFRWCGIAAMIFSRTPVTESARKITPLTKTMPSASCHGTPRAPQIVKVKKALMPIPGASAMG